MFNFIQNYRKHGDNLNYWDLLKAVAIMTMVIDHIGSYLYPDELWLRAIGRIHVPIWLFLAGYAQPKKQGYEIILLALLLMFADFTFGKEILPANILVSILACRVFVANIAKQDREFISFGFLIMVLLALYPVTVSLFEYGSLAFLFALSGHYYRQKRDKLAITSMVVCIISFILIQYYNFSFSIPQTILMSIGTIYTCWLLHGFSIKPVTSGSKPLDRIMMFLGRNSLYIYFIHIIMFLWIGWLINPDAPSLFTLKLLKLS